MKRPKGPRRPGRRPPTSALLTGAELARAERVDERTIRRWRTQGLRPEPGHRPPKYRLAKVRAWRTAHEPEEQRLRRSHIELLDARSRTAARRLAELQAQYAPAAAWAREWAGLDREARTHCGRLVAELPAIVMATTPRTPSMTEHVVRQHVYACLTRLSQYRQENRAALSRVPVIRAHRVLSSSTVSAARAQLNERSAALAAFREQLAGGECQAVRDVEADWSRRVHAMRAQLLALPTRLAPELAGATDQEAVRATLARTVAEAVENLNRGIPTDAEEDA